MQASKRKSGRPWETGGLEDHLLIMLIYYRCYVTQEFIGFFYRVDKSAICRAIKRIETLAKPLFGVQREPKLSREEAEAVMLDCTEQPIQRLGGLAPETYGPPCPQAVSAIRSEQSASTYPVSGSNPGQDGDPRVLVLISGTASNAIFRDRFPKHRLTVRPSRFHHPQTLYGSRCRVIIAGRSLSRRGSSGGEPRLGAQQRPRDPGQFAR